MSSFQDFIPKMAKEYGFEYELVQYKWPRWLNQQKEKQRVMWGYVHVKSEKSVFFCRSNCLNLFDIIHSTQNLFSTFDTLVYGIYMLNIIFGVFYCRYKILFLDVLFPLDVKKFIFVDADQVNKIVFS